MYILTFKSFWAAPRLESPMYLCHYRDVLCVVAPENESATIVPVSLLLYPLLPAAMAMPTLSSVLFIYGPVYVCIPFQISF